MWAGDSTVGIRRQRVRLSKEMTHNCPFSSNEYLQPPVYTLHNSEAPSAIGDNAAKGKRSRCQLIRPHLE
jgi:hypothetical protein